MNVIKSSDSWWYQHGSPDEVGSLLWVEEGVQFGRVHTHKYNRAVHEHSKANEATFGVCPDRLTEQNRQEDRPYDARGDTVDKNVPRFVEVFRQFPGYKREGHTQNQQETVVDVD